MWVCSFCREIPSQERRCFVGGFSFNPTQTDGLPPITSLPEFMNLKLFGKTSLVAKIKQFGDFSWAIHSESEQLTVTHRGLSRTLSTAAPLCRREARAGRVEEARDLFDPSVLGPMTL